MSISAKLNDATYTMKSITNEDKFFGENQLINRNNCENRANNYQKERTKNLFQDFEGKGRISSI